MIEDRFWSKVDKDGPVMRAELGPCWVWTGNKRTGYGMIREEGRASRMLSAHRLSWAWANNEPYPERHVDIRHRCDNPPCVRPEHLESGTRLDNNHDTWKRDRGFSLLTNENVSEARVRARTGESVHEIIKDYPGVDVNRLIPAIRGVTFPYAEAEPCEPNLFKVKLQKLTVEQYMEISEALNKPWRGQGEFLARKYGVSKALISKIKNGKFWPVSMQ